MCASHVTPAPSAEEMPHQGERHISVWLQRRPARSGAFSLPRCLAHLNRSLCTAVSGSHQRLCPLFMRRSSPTPRVTAQLRTPRVPFFRFYHVTRHPKPRSWATTPRPSRSPTMCPCSCSWRMSSCASRVRSRSPTQLSLRDLISAASFPALELSRNCCTAGPGVVTEATCIGVPVVVEFNESTLAQEVGQRIV